MKFSHRFHECAAAKLVLAIASRLTNAALFLERNPSNDGRTGDWNIGSQEDVDSVQCNRLSDCVNMATTMALADELRKYNPHHPLCNIWHLREENRASVGRYNLRNDSTPAEDV